MAGMHYVFVERKQNWTKGETKKGETKNGAKEVNKKDTFPLYEYVITPKED